MRYTRAASQMLQMIKENILWLCMSESIESLNNRSTQYALHLSLLFQALIKEALVF